MLLKNVQNRSLARAAQKQAFAITTLPSRDREGANAYFIAK
jgi:hypothetical protein